MIKQELGERMAGGAKRRAPDPKTCNETRKYRFKVDDAPFVSSRIWKELEKERKN